MSEARGKYIYLKDVDESTFIRFIEYAYKNDYTEPNPETLYPSIDAKVGCVEGDFPREGCKMVRRDNTAIEPEADTCIDPPVEEDVF